MSTSLSIHSTLNNHVQTNCVDQGCTLKIGQNITNCTIFKIESYWTSNKKNGKICDFILPCDYNDNDRVVMTEHRNKNCKVSQLPEKFNNALGEVNQILTSTFTDFDNTHLLLVSKKISTPELVQLRGIKLNFFNKKGKRIIHIRCDSTLESILRKIDKSKK